MVFCLVQMFSQGNHPTFCPTETRHLRFVTPRWVVPLPVGRCLCLRRAWTSRKRWAMMCPWSCGRDSCEAGTSWGLEDKSFLQKTVLRLGLCWGMVRFIQFIQSYCWFLPKVSDLWVFLCPPPVHPPLGECTGNTEYWLFFLRPLSTLKQYIAYGL